MTRIPVIDVSNQKPVEKQGTLLQFSPAVANKSCVHGCLTLVYIQKKTDVWVETSAYNSL